MPDQNLVRSKDLTILDKLDRERAEIRASGDRADRKAQILITITGVVLGLTVGLVGRWVGESTTRWPVMLFAYISLVLLGSSIGLFLAVVRPDLGAGTALERSAWNRILREIEGGGQSTGTIHWSAKVRAVLNGSGRAVEKWWRDVVVGVRNDHDATVNGLDLLNMLKSEDLEARHLRYAKFAHELARRTHVKHRRISSAMVAMFAGAVSISIAFTLHGSNFR